LVYLFLQVYSIDVVILITNFDVAECWVLGGVFLFFMLEISRWCCVVVWTMQVMEQWGLLYKSAYTFGKTIKPSDLPFSCMV
jgi:hypothetical protein